MGAQRQVSPELWGAAGAQEGPRKGKGGREINEINREINNNTTPNAQPKQRSNNEMKIKIKLIASLV